MSDTSTRLSDESRRLKKVALYTLIVIVGIVLNISLCLWICFHPSSFKYTSQWIVTGEKIVVRSSFGKVHLHSTEAKVLTARRSTLAQRFFCYALLSQLRYKEADKNVQVGLIAYGWPAPWLYLQWRGWPNNKYNYIDIINTKPNKNGGVIVKIGTQINVINFSISSLLWISLCYISIRLLTYSYCACVATVSFLRKLLRLSVSETSSAPQEGLAPPSDISGEPRET